MVKLGILNAKLAECTPRANRSPAPAPAAPPIAVGVTVPVHVPAPVPKTNTKVFASEVASIAVVAAKKSVPEKAPKKTNDDSFVMVQKRKHRPRITKNRCDMAPMEPNVKIRAAGPNTPVYISSLHYTTKAEDIAEYMRQKLRYTPKVQLLESRRNVNFKTFVVSMPNCMLDQALSESFWPKSMVFRRFRGIVPPERTKT